MFFLETESIGLKKLTQKECTETYVDWMNDEQVTRTLVSGKTPQSIEDVQSFIAISNHASRITFAIYRKDQNHHIGNVKLDHIDWINRKADFGILIGDRASWGKGYATQATKLVIDYAFSVLNLNRVYLGVLESNPSASTIYRNIGFLEEGRKKQDQLFQGQYVDSLIMAITRQRWLVHGKKVVAIIQARCSSSRLPGKVLKELGGKPMIQQVYDRVQKARSVHQTIIATSVDSSDNPLAQFCEHHSISYYRGDLNDVLTRFSEAAKKYQAQILVRITGDCPLIDPEVIDRVVQAYQNNVQNVDYASNIDFLTYPDGLDTEVFSIQALEQANQKATLKSDREHVTPYMRKHLRKINVALDQANYSHLRWTVDQQEDFDFVQKIFQDVGKEGRHFGMDEILQWIRSHPQEAERNAHIPINEGLEKSLKAERTI